MKKFLNLDKTSIQNAILAAAKKHNLIPQAIEKDLWVTQTLHALFSLPISEGLVFKGGTSLSKAWSLIERFSEDIDLALDSSLLGFPHGDLTKKQLKKLRKVSSVFVRDDLTEMLRYRINEMGLSEWLSIEPQPNGEGDATYPEPRQIYVHYHSFLPNENGYLRSDIVLEVSARSLVEPTGKVEVHSLLSDTIPINDSCNPIVTAATPAKTFLEKVFLIHELFSIAGHGKSANRKSRHLYDLYRMMNKDFALAAVEDDALWETIRHHREIFTSVRDMDYTPDIRRRLVLVPREDIMENWRRDYEVMCQSMIYGDKPTFSELLDAMRELERRFNS